MEFCNFKPTDIQRTVDTLNTMSGGYGGNLRFDTTSSRESTKGWRVRGVLRVNNSRAHGARLSHSGRHTPCASWEAHRDFMRVLFDLNPEGRIKTAMADYRGREDFEAKYRATGDKNIGSLVMPVTMPELTV